MRNRILILLFPLIVTACSQTGCPVVKPIILRQISHDQRAFTQGLLLHDHKLYESTGGFGQSTIRSLSTENGETRLKKKLPKSFFGEGITHLDGKIYQLTWKSGIVMVYSLPLLNLEKTLSISGQGWGLTTIGRNFVMSNGSSMLHIMAQDFKLVDEMVVRYKSKTIKRLNELEYANGKIYANQWKTNYIFEIEYPTGKVTKIIDCTEIASSLSGLKAEDVLNGIAHNQSRNSFYITGKNWPTIFEVTFP